MAINSQLIKKNETSGGYNNVFPKTFIDAIKDRETGQTLCDILNGFNMYFLSYVGSREQTRLQVPSILRRTGLCVTYILYGGTIVNEYFIGDNISDSEFEKDDNWEDIYKIPKPISGTTQQRPSNTIYIGFQYFDTTLNKPIWWTGTNWIDSGGIIV